MSVSGFLPPSFYRSLSPPSNGPVSPDFPYALAPPSAEEVDEAPRLGSPLLVIASPFGLVQPSVFQSSVTAGVCSGTLGSSGAALTDARCLPGSEVRHLHPHEFTAGFSVLQCLDSAPINKQPLASSQLST